MSTPSPSTSKPIVLVACELPGEENLGVRYVAQALIEAGFAVEILALNTLSGLMATANAILRLAPDLVGLSMSDNQVAASQLALVALLRARGYANFIVAGGALATVARHELLAKHEGLDAIIRREGEGPMVALARRVYEGASLETVPGVTTRAGDGIAQVECDVMPVARPFREELPKVLGMRVARVMASRGCNGSCSYCGSTAVRKDAVAEARRAGMPLELIRQSGLASQRVRPLADFADEIAELHHNQQVRFFRLIDDHILGPDADSARKWLRSLEHELKLRRVQRVAFSMMVEPSVVTDAVADAMRDLGIVRVLVGVESLTTAGLRALGRNPRLLEANRMIIKRLRDRGISVFYNSIFLHSESTPESVRAELEGLPFVSGLPFDVLPLLVFPGTGLYSRLQREGKLLGGMLGCDYTIAHPVISLMRSLLHGLTHQLPTLTALSVNAFDVASLYALTRRCHERNISSHQQRDLFAVVDRIGNLRSSVLIELLGIAETTMGSGDHAKHLADLVGSTQPRMVALENELESHRQSVEGRASTPSVGPRLFASTLMAAGLVVIGPGCGGTLEPESPSQATGSGGTVHGSGGSALQQGGSTMTSTATGSGGASDAQGGAGTGGAPTILPSSGGGGGLPNYASTDCTAYTLQTISARLDSLTRPACSFPPYDCHEYQLRIDATGHVVDLLWAPADQPDSSAAVDLARSCVIQVLAKEAYPCLTDGFAWRHHDCILLL